MRLFFACVGIHLSFFSLPSPRVDHESVASVSADLGTCYYNSGKYELAISTFEDGLRIILLGENDRSLEVAEALYKIASSHDSLCKYDEGKCDMTSHCA